jgi:hypothetical protein
MDLADVFADLDRVAWPKEHHAYDPADDVPGLPRALTGEDQETVAEAEQELWGSIVHQGSVYEATVVAVPFLARLAAAGVRRSARLQGRAVYLPGRVAVHDVPVVPPVSAGGIIRA